jgi:hypothetical protein
LIQGGDTVNVYRNLAHRLLQEAARADEPAKAERLKKRAQEYVLLADLLEEPEPPIADARMSPVLQQQQQRQDDDEK